MTGMTISRRTSAILFSGSCMILYLSAVIRLHDIEIALQKHIGKNCTVYRAVVNDKDIQNLCVQAPGESIESSTEPLP